MKNVTLLFLLFFFGFLNSLNGQSEKEVEIIRKIKTIGESISPNENDAPSIKSSLRKFKKLSRKNKKDTQVAAVTNALIGKALSDKKYFKEATRFYKRAYKYRKKQGDFYSQRWALKALMNNGLDNKDAAFVKKYAIEWIDLTYKDSSKVRKLYSYPYEGRNYFENELGGLILKLHPEIWSDSWRTRYQSWDTRREVSHEVLKYYFQTFPKNREIVLSTSKNMYHYIIKDFLKVNNIEKANYWKNKSIKLFKENASEIEHSNFLRFLAAHFRLSEGWGEYGVETTKYEYVGIELIHEYTETCKKLKRYDQVLFGYRYIATRYAVLNDYKKAVQYLATAIKYCHSYNMEDESVKSRGGLHLIVQKIRKAKNITGLQAAKDWKNGFDLTGLTKEEIEDFDDILRDGSWN